MVSNKEPKRLANKPHVYLKRAIQKISWNPTDPRPLLQALNEVPCEKIAVVLDNMTALREEHCGWQTRLWKLQVFHQSLDDMFPK